MGPPHLMMRNPLMERYLQSSISALLLTEFPIWMPHFSSQKPWSDWSGGGGVASVYTSRSRSGG